MAAPLIAEIFSGIRSSEEKTVVVIGPNHFLAGISNIQTTTDGWKTPFGKLTTNSNLALDLQQDDVARIEQNSFTSEHSISVIAPFIKHSLPKAKILPIIIKDGTPEQDLDQLAGWLSQKLLPQDIVIGSFDFSHYLPSAAADFHDQTALTALLQLSTENIDRLELDSTSGLYAVMEYAKSVGYTTFTPVSHTNSAKLIGDDSIKETTSYITGYFSNSGPETFPHLTTLWINSKLGGLEARPSLADEILKHPAKGYRLFSGTDISIAAQDPASVALEPYGFNVFQEDIETKTLTYADLDIVFHLSETLEDSPMVRVAGPEIYLDLPNSTLGALGIDYSPQQITYYWFPFNVIDGEIKLELGIETGIMKLDQ